MHKLCICVTELNLVPMFVRGETPLIIGKVNGRFQPRWRLIFYLSRRMTRSLYKHDKIVVHTALLEKFVNNTFKIFLQLYVLFLFSSPCICYRQFNASKKNLCSRHLVLQIEKYLAVSNAESTFCHVIFIVRSIDDGNSTAYCCNSNGSMTNLCVYNDKLITVFVNQNVNLLVCTS